MAQAIDPIALKAAAEHLEWVLRQYPSSDDVQSLLNSLTPLIEAAKAGRVLVPVSRKDVPGGYNFGDGVYSPYKNPNVEDAYVNFRIEIRGGLTEEDRQRIARMDAMRKGMMEGSQP
jgi:hypothetical protein